MGRPIGARQLWWVPATRFAIRCEEIVDAILMLAPASRPGNGNVNPKGNRQVLGRDSRRGQGQHARADGQERGKVRSGGRPRVHQRRCRSDRRQDPGHVGQAVGPAVWVDTP
jgi:hypothetical protein